MTLPIADNIPEIAFNIEGLRRHSALCNFVRNEELSDTDRRLRAWLLHTVHSATRHYKKARELVILQNNADQQQDGGLVLHLLDVSEQIENCVTGVFRSCMAVRRMADSNDICRAFTASHNEAIGNITALRNQFDHMHMQIVTGETGNGPISIVFSDFGNFINFRKLKIETASLHQLLKGLYEVLASMHTGFDVNSPAHPGGPMKLIMSASIQVTKGDDANG